MGFKSSTFRVQTNGKTTAKSGAKTLQSRHKGAMEEVVNEAKHLADERRRTLEQISDSKLRISAAR